MTARRVTVGHFGGAGGAVARGATIALVNEVTQRELRNESGEIMRRLDRGESFVVTRNGVPVAELTPLRRHRFVAADTAVAMFRGAPAIDHGRFRADLDEIAAPGSEPLA
jgi:prevent-host-death family protein